MIRVDCEMGMDGWSWPISQGLYRSDIITDNSKIKNWVEKFVHFFIKYIYVLWNINYQQ